MRQFDLKHGWLVPNPGNESADPGRTIYPEAMRMAEDGWDRRAQPVRGTGEHGDERARSESVQRREDHVTDEELDAAREWLRHVEAGRIGS